MVLFITGLSDTQVVGIELLEVSIKASFCHGELANKGTELGKVCTFTKHSYFHVPNESAKPF